MTNKSILQVTRPARPLPIIYDSPHSGCVYPPDFAPDCDPALLPLLQDRYIDDLFSNAPLHGASLLCALFPRCYIDVNRARDDIDLNLLKGRWPDQRYGPIFPTTRSDSGFGLIPRLIKPGIPLYSHKIGAEKVMNRIMTYYDPYHDALRGLIQDAYYAYGQVWHINCHSMPEHTAYPKTHVTMIGGNPMPSDIVLGDRDGETCGRDFMNALRDFWQALGYRVTVNDPFKGVELIRKYSQPTCGKNSVQIEINRRLFMNEETGEKTKNYETLKGHVQQMMVYVSAFIQTKITSLAAD